MSRKPLEGIRICDLSSFWSGPISTSYLGGMGAEVIKIESVQRPDGFRFGTGPTENWWEVYGPWNCVNLNKYDLTLDLTRPRGVELFRELASVSDVVIENFTPRVMESFGLTYPVLRKMKPDIVMLSMPGYGVDSPWRDYVGYGPVFEHVSGLAYVTGYQDGVPVTVGGAADPIAGMHAAFAILSALEYRRRSGNGQYIDMSQVEALTGLMGTAVVDYSVSGRIWTRTGNRSAAMSPHGVYRCKGDDTWIALAVSSDAEWKAFCRVVGRPELSSEERFATLAARRENEDELDRLVEAWTIDRDCRDVMNTLQQAGVPAGVVVKPLDAPSDPQFKERGFYHELTRDVVGKQIYPGWPVRLSKAPVASRPSPKLGEHNALILGELLGLSQLDMDKLNDDWITGTEPMGATK